MSGIIVGIDGSSHSQAALKWAMSEATLCGEPVSVITVLHLTAAVGHGMAVCPSNREMVVKARGAAEEAVAKVGAQPG
jgi:nucleotide-binding universal stress UspA family protein